MARNQQGTAPQGLRQQAGQSSRNTMFTLRKSVRAVLMILFALNFINVIVYNTGWLPWTGTNGDVIWSTIVGTCCVMGVIMLLILDK